MLENKISEDDIIAFIHYKNNMNEYFRISEEKAKEIENEITTNPELNEFYLTHLESFNRANNSVKSPNWKYLSSAAIFVIALISYYLFATSAQTISINDFSLKILRSETSAESSEMNTWIRQLRDGKNSLVLDQLEQDITKSSSLIYAVALLMHGQETENVALLKQSKAILFNHEVDPKVVEKLDNLINSLEKAK